MLALLASFASPGLAVAHGLAHAHGAKGHHVRDHDDAGARPFTEELDQLDTTGSAHGADHEGDHVIDHDHGGEPGEERRHNPAGAIDLSQDEISAALTDQEHHHQHDHARVEPVATAKSDVQSEVTAPVMSIPAAVVLPLATHARPPLTRWDTVALARPAPDTGPPPTLRAPPTR